jgi:hypothetical protein
MWNVVGANCWIEGFYFPASTAAATDRIGLAASDTMVKDCYFECGASDTNRALRVHTSAGGGTIDGCSFVATASRPAVGLEISAAVNGVTVQNCTFDGGSYGWTDYAFKVSAAATALTARDLTFTNRSDLGITVTATSYKLFGIDLGGTGNVRLDA